MVCVKEEEDPGEKLSQDEIISRTKQVIQGLEALKQEHHSILDSLLGTLRCLKQDEEGVLVEEKSHMIRKSLEMLELGLSEAQVRLYFFPEAAANHYQMVSHYQKKDPVDGSGLNLHQILIEHQPSTTPELSA